MQHLWVDPVAGKDTNSGTRSAPLKTITKALGGRNFDLTVHLLPGTYGPQSNGDFWDTTANKGRTIPINGFKRLKIVGVDRKTTILDFNGIDNLWNGMFNIRGTGTEDIEITNLTFTKLDTTAIWATGPVQTHAGVKKVDIHGNLFIDTGSSFISWGGFDVAFHDNVVINTASAPRYIAVRVRTQFGSANNGDRTYIYNNLIVGHTHGISYGSRNKAAQWICNNLIVDGNIAFPGNAAPPAHVKLENNITWRNRTIAGFTVPASNKNTDPLLVDIAKRDFRQKPGSPCREAGYPIPGLSWMRNDWYGNARASDADDDRLSLPDVGVHEVVDVSLSVSNWGLGKSAIFRLQSPAQSFAGVSVFMFAYGRSGFLAALYGSIGFDPSTLLFSTGTTTPGTIPLPIPMDNKLRGLVLHAQGFGLKGTTSGFVWKPSGTLDLEL